jgi:hypothetical protein
VNTGGSFSIALSKEGSSMSVLLAGNAENLRRRWTLHEQTYRLLDWFLFIESLAWKRIEDYYQGRRLLPEKLFLVQGQTLTSQCDISHRRCQDGGCDVMIEADAQIPNAVDAQFLVNCGVKRASAAMGFECRRKQHDGAPMWSIFLETYDSFRLHFFSLKRFKGRKKQIIEQRLRYGCPQYTALADANKVLER